MAMQILSENPISMVELKEELEKTRKRDKELNFRATKTEEYLQKFVEILRNVVDLDARVM